MPQWLVPTRLQANELFSSWLVRTALSQGCDPLVLTGELWPKWRAWTLDIDRGISPERLLPLAKISGISAEALNASMIRPVAEMISPDLGLESGTWPWILALGSRNRKRNGGLQFCPHCLEEDKKPYYRLNWRFAWHTACAKHQTRLLDECPACHVPIEPHRLIAMDGRMILCSSCKADLRSASTDQANAGALKLQTTADSVIRDGHGIYGNAQQSVSEWFGLVRYFAVLIRRVAVTRPERLGMALTALSVDVENISGQSTGLSLELSKIRDRERILGNAWRLVTAGPEALLAAAKDAALGVQTLRESRQRFPAVLEQVIAELPGNGRLLRKPRASSASKPKSGRTVMKMWLRLQRKARMAER